MNSSHLYCESCGTANKTIAKFCRACGKPLSSGPLPSLSQDPPIDQTIEARGLGGYLAPGHLLKKQYRILERLGEGGMGTVYKAEDMSLGRRLVAVKEMLQKGFSSGENYEKAVRAFEGEALLLAKLMHPNLPRIYNHFGEVGRWYLVMDFINGETLTEHLAKAKNGHLSVEEVLDIGIQLCRVLTYLHTNKPTIIFRDLKPDNVMLTPEGNVYLIDFGIARLFKTGKAGDTDAFGTFGYAAPEQYGKGQTTPRSDIYSLGATLHQLLSGQDPTSNVPLLTFSPLQVPGQVMPAELNTLIMQMVDIDERKRPANMATIRQELERLQNLKQEAAQPPSEQKPASRLEPLPADPPEVVSKQEAAQPSTSKPPDAGQPLPRPITSKPPDLPPMPLREMQVRHTGLVRAVAWSRDGAFLASGSEDKTVQVWNMRNGESLLTYRGHGSDEVRALAWSADGVRVASAGWDKTIQVWEISTGNRVLSYSGHTDYVRALAWSADGKYIASAGKDRKVQVWHAANGSNLHTYAAHTDTINAVAWSPDGTRLVSGSHDKTVRIWQATTGNLMFTYSHAKAVYGVAWSPDGKYVASCSEDKTVQVWDVTTKSQVFTYTGHNSWVYAVAWSPSSERLASASKDKTVQVWKAPTGEAYMTYNCQSEQTYAVDWSFDGKRIAYGDGRMVQVKLI